MNKYVKPYSIITDFQIYLERDECFMDIKDKEKIKCIQQRDPPYLGDIYNEKIDFKVLSLETRSTLLKREIHDGNFQIFLQPKFDFKNHVHGAEALIRYYNEKGDLYTPEFIPFLEKYNLIHIIDFYVFEEVCKVLEKWQMEHQEIVTISLNFSRKTLMLMDLIPQMNAICNRYHVNKEWIEIEITETLNATDIDIEEKVIEYIHNSGYRLSLDDFGVDYSNLLYLVKYPFQILKLDKSLIDEIEYNWKNRVILENVILTCHRMDIQVVAEGVENKKQLRFLKKVNCDFIQGYIIDRPIPIAEFEKKYLNIKQY